MIKFFRQIRHTMIMENSKSARYFKYAIGEIILVVIGILIALQINNWNEQRKNNVKEKNYLLGIERDLQQQLSDISYNVQGEISVIQSLEEALKLYQPTVPISRELIVLISPVNDRFTFSRVSTTFDEIQSAGNLDLIRNQNLKDAIASYYASLKRTEDVIRNNARQANNTISLKTLELTEISGPSANFDKPTLVGSFDNYETSNELLNIIRLNLEKPENSIALLNCIRMKHNISQWHVKKYEDIKIETEALLSMINSDL